MPRLKLMIAYVGTQYHGWQTQARKNASPLPTIQNIIEDAVAHVLGERVHVHGAGRTDAGVHAEAQVAHLDVPESRARMDWQLALNTLLPRDIRIADAVLVPDTFHAQHSAVRKTYEYRLWLSKRYTPPQLFPFVWACGPVDVERMDEGSRYLLGKRDFASLKNAGTDLRTTVRTILSITRTPEGPLPERLSQTDGPQYHGAARRCRAGQAGTGGHSRHPRRLRSPDSSPHGSGLRSDYEKSMV